MTIYDLNPGDLIRIKGKDWSFLEPVLNKDVPIHHLKLNDSFPEAVIAYENGREYRKAFTWARVLVKRATGKDLHVFSLY